MENFKPLERWVDEKGHRYFSFRVEDMREFLRGHSDDEIFFIEDHNGGMFSFRLVGQMRRLLPEIASAGPF